MLQSPTAQLVTVLGWGVGQGLVQCDRERVSIDARVCPGQDHVPGALVPRRVPRGVPATAFGSCLWMFDSDCWLFVRSEGEWLSGVRRSRHTFASLESIPGPTCGNSRAGVIGKRTTWTKHLQDQPIHPKHCRTVPLSSPSSVSVLLWLSHPSLNGKRPEMSPEL